MAAYLPLLRPWPAIKAYAVGKSAGHYVYGRKVAQISTVHFWRNISDVAFYLPDALAGATFVSEQMDVAGVTLGIVSAYQRKQSTLACSILSLQSPPLSFADSPIDVLQNGTFAVAYAYVLEF